jgi:GntR family transcriptional regulator
MNTRKHSQPMYREIADRLRVMIEEGQVAPLQRLPSEADLCRTYGTTRPTVREAYRVLVLEGLVERRGPQGYFVRPISTQSWLMAGHGAAVTGPWRVSRPDEADDWTVRTVAPGRQIRGRRLGDMLNIAKGGSDRVVCRETVRYVDKDPIEIVSIYVANDLVGDTPAVNEEFSGVVLDLLVNKGYRLTGYVDVVVGRNPRDDERETLERESPVNEVLRQVFFLDPGQPQVDSESGPDGRCRLVIHSIIPAAESELEYCITL